MKEIIKIFEPRQRKSFEASLESVFRDKNAHAGLITAYVSLTNDPADFFARHLKVCLYTLSIGRHEYFHIVFDVLV